MCMAWARVRDRGLCLGCGSYCEKRCMVSDPLDWLQGTQQHAGADARCFAGNIHHEGRAVGKIDVAVAATEKQRLVAWRLAAKPATGGIAKGG